MGFGGPGESLCVDFDEDEGMGYGPDWQDAERKPLDEYTTKELGAEGERLAANFLAEHGYRILEMNWRCRAGEVDIVATEDEPDEEARHSVVRLLGLLYLVDHTDGDSVRFDVVAINVVGYGHAKLRHLICAYSWDD